MLSVCLSRMSFSNVWGHIVLNIQKPLQLMSCSFHIMFLLLRASYCYFLHLYFIKFSSCFDNTNTHCQWDFSITLGHFSVSYSSPGGAFVYQNTRGGHCNNVWTLNGSLTVSHHFQGFVLKVFAPWPLVLIVCIWPLLLTVCISSEKDPSTCSITGRLIAQIQWHPWDHAESTETLRMLRHGREDEEQPIW